MRIEMRQEYKLIIISLLLSGCGALTQSDFAAKGLHSAPIGSVASALPEEMFASGEWPARKWWQQFADPQLDAFMERAIVENPTISAWKQKIVGAQERAKAVRARLFPQLNMDAHYADQHLSRYNLFRVFAPIPAVVAEADIHFTLNYEFDFWGKNRFTFNAALNEAKSVAAEGAQSKLLITLSVAEHYFDLKANRAKRALLLRVIESRNQHLKLTRERRATGVANEDELLAAQMAVRQVEQSMKLLEEQIAEDLYSLNELTARDMSDESGTLEPFVPASMKSTIPQNLPIDLISRRPDIMVQIWRVEAAADLIGAARADFFPNINLNAIGGLNSIFMNRFFNIHSFQGLIEPAMHLPVFTGGKRRAVLKERVAEYEEAIYAYNQAILTAAREVSQRIEVVTKVRERLDLQTGTLKDEQHRFQLEKSRNEQGLTSDLRLTSYCEELLNKEYEELELERLEYKSILGLILALGGGYGSSS